MGVIFGSANAVHSTIERLTPFAVDAYDTGYTIGGCAQLETCDVTGVCNARAIALLDVGERTTDIHVIASTVNGLHHELVALDTVGDAYGLPLGSNLTRGGIHDHET